MAEPQAASAGLGGLPGGSDQTQQAAAQLGCSKCRYAAAGCGRCRNPAFRPRRGSVPREELAALARQQRRAAPGEPAGAARPAKRRRAAQAPAQGSSGGESLVSQLRRHLSQAEPGPVSADGLAESLQRLHTSASVGSGEGAAAADAATAAAAPAEGRSRPPTQEPEAAGTVPMAVGNRKRAVGAEGAAAGDPPLHLQRPAKQRRVGGGRPLPAAPRAKKRPRSPGAQAGVASPPRRYHKALQPGEQAQQAAVPGAAGAAAVPSAAAAGGAGAEAASELPPPADAMDIDEQPPGGGGGAEGLFVQQEPTAPPGACIGGLEAAVEPAGGGGAVSASLDVDMEAPVAAAAAEAAAEGSSRKRDFMSLLEANMERRRQERRASEGGAAPLPQLLLTPGAAKRQRRAQQAQQTSPATSSGQASPAPTAEAAQPDPRLCLWEPPVSPFGLLEEELYDDPWKVLVACMLLNKTTSTQVRKVIWDLFQLCPTPAAAVAADVGRIEALIQPLGLFRKRAVAIQRLSQDYLHKQWRDPQELFGIGKYAADAYWIFCRGRWRETAPEDKDLLRYVRWLESTGGEGSGLERHRTVELGPPMGAAAAAVAAGASPGAAAAAAEVAAGWRGGRSSSFLLLKVPLPDSSSPSKG